MFREPEADKDLHLFHVLVYLYFLNFSEGKNHLTGSLETLEPPNRPTESDFPRRHFLDDAHQNILGTSALHELSDHLGKGL